MVELKFYTDGDKVYLNMDNGITKEVDLSAITGGSGGGGGEGDGGGGGATDDFVSFDVVLDINFDTYSGSVLKGNYNAVREKITNNTPIVVGVHTTAGTSQTFTIAAKYELTENAIYFAVFIPDGSAFDSYWNWLSDGTLVTDD